MFLSYTEPVNSCGYILAKNNEMNQYGVIDREGKFHSFSEDLSTLPDFDQLNMEGLGDGYILATEEELGLERQTGGYVIRSLDGGQTVGGSPKLPPQKCCRPLPLSFISIRRVRSPWVSLRPRKRHMPSRPAPRCRIWARTASSMRSALKMCCSLKGWRHHHHDCAWRHRVCQRQS